MNVYEMKSYRMTAGRKLELPDGQRIVAVVEVDLRPPGTPAGTIELAVLVELESR